MNRRTIGRVAAVLLMCIGAGCSKKVPAEREAAPSSETQDNQRAGADSAAGGATVASSDSSAGGEVHLTGTLGCGHCDFQVTSDCSASMKTASGDVYVLDGVSEGSELWTKREEPGHKITVVGTVLAADGLKHVAMTSFDIK